MTRKQAALSLFALSALAEGVISAWARTSLQGPNVLFWVGAAEIFTGLFLIFLWLRGDELDYRFRRTAAMNIGIVALTVVFVPVYLFRSRPEGRRARAVGLFFLCLLAWYGCLVVGAIAGMLVFGLPRT